MKRYRIGILGAGFGVSAHLPALRAHPRFEVVALASPHSAARIAAEREIPHAFRDAAGIIAGCELDAVTVASQPFAHAQDVLAALEAGLHVVCEKPFALDVAQAEAMVAAAIRAGTACGIAHEFRFVAQMQALRELVANGHLDPVRHLELTLLRAMLHRNGTRPRGWWFRREMGGGLTGAMVSHLVDHANWLVGRIPTRALGFLRTANVGRRDAEGPFESSVDDGGFALLEYGGGIVARISADATTAVESYTCAIHGEDRSAVASGPNVVDLRLFSVNAEETDELECAPSPYAAYASVNPNVPLLMELYDEFAKAIDGQPNALPTFVQALETQKVLAAIGYSATG
ncbi:MAG TPA: Gfo/Idh/MocA family oxidoreductase [Candidatus Tumulicola sp.]|nr:Gfo/Idh/MocA family oxidoreductase [Candidatus Tumulicola sp.]